MSKNPLGTDSDYPLQYAPEVLHGIARADGRSLLSTGPELPFHGEDVWNAWELSWLDASGKPVAATAELRVPAASERLIESKSLKLYLNSLAMTSYASADAVAGVISADLSAVAAAPVAVTIALAGDAGPHAIQELPGASIDRCGGEFSFDKVDPSRLRVTDGPVGEHALHSHLLRSNCPVTGQPDTGSLLVRYRGRPIDRGALLAYVVSYRSHNDFHEACVERIFMDIRSACATENLTVYARYNRRGGLDINPFRSDFEHTAENPRLWRQ